MGLIKHSCFDIETDSFGVWSVRDSILVWFKLAETSAARGCPLIHSVDLKSQPDGGQPA